MSKFKWLLLLACCHLLCQCANSTGGSSSGTPNMGGPSVAERSAAISNEATGDFYYGRRYYVKKTRFWGYIRSPRQSASKAKLVIFDESRKKAPDRLPESGSAGAQYGFDNNFEYRIKGGYTGSEAYDPNSNQFLPVFRITGYDVVNRNPGWLFSPADHFDPYSVTLVPR